MHLCLKELRRFPPPLSIPQAQEALIANHTASAVLAMQAGRVEGALKALAAAVEVEMAMPYGLPPNWRAPQVEIGYGRCIQLVHG